MTAPACRCASPVVAWCEVHRAWSPVPAADAVYATDPRLRAATTEPRR